ncbi:hypothetical protein E2A64_03775 [Pseudohoeflea suaedae]|uniref:Uncharacterized protein n=1 Tax=Pseudohoeflea suaedae TaxID=877384 RepID=A0A4R5PMN9_9HYPH|nr:hypothetical protein [Pseudohoeflea suaedae]TDH38246.1 hypothetical protein E2A64_03775 [Pseudohoeflea suaedae]
MATGKGTSQFSHEPLFDVIGRVSTELRDVAKLIEQLEPMLSDAQSDEYLESPEHMRLLQGIDLAVQKSRGLAAFLDSVSDELDVSHLVDITTALNLVTLSDMKMRLRAAVDTKQSAETYQLASGDLDFF